MAARKRQERSRDEGAAAVEFALVWAFVLGPIIYGIIAFGFVMNDQITASQLAREIARYAAICAGQSGASSATCNASASSQFSSDEPNSWKSRNATVSVDTSGCIAGTSSVQTATVSVTPVLPVPVVAKVQGKASTPCGG